ncbi:MAG TPA: hypothetical protein VN688_05395, partial [Gemmataceae bacterium]|nr:hypothetical protein [Gemmataceae bacterium]
QGLKELAHWQDEHQVRNLHVLYYGTDTSLGQLPMRPLAVGHLQLGREGLPAPAQGGTLAVGTSIVYGSVSKDYQDLQELTRSLRHLTPVDRTATFLIYHLPADEELATANNQANPTMTAAP